MFYCKIRTSDFQDFSKMLKYHIIVAETIWTINFRRFPKFEGQNEKSFPKNVFDNCGLQSFAKIFQNVFNFVYTIKRTSHSGLKIGGVHVCSPAHAAYVVSSFCNYN